jgi:hypothetical protein
MIQQRKCRIDVDRNATRVLSFCCSKAICQPGEEGLCVRECVYVQVRNGQSLHIGCFAVRSKSRDVVRLGGSPRGKRRGAR